jgi:hypothetical protein
MTVSILIGIFEEKDAEERLEPCEVAAVTTNSTINRIATMVNEQQSMERPQSRWRTATRINVRSTQGSRVERTLAAAIS